MNNESNPQRLTGDSRPEPPSRLARMFSRRLMTKAAIALVAMLIVLYLVEGLHGAYAWSRAKARLEARGEKVAWADFVPGTPIPDAQNLFKHPYILEYGIRHTWLELGKQVGWLQHGHIGDGLEAGPPVPLATLKKLLRQRVKRETLLSLDPKLAEQEEMLELTIDAGPLADAIQVLARQAGIHVTTEPYLTPFAEKGGGPEVTVQATNVTAAALLDTLLKQHHLEPQLDFTPGSYRLVPVLTSLEELLERLNTEPDQLKQFEEALARPHAQLRWTAETPLEELPKLNYVLLRVAAQGLGTRSSIYLLQAKPVAALRDLQFIKRLEKFAASDPGLTGIMLIVALDGIRATLIEEALAEGLWPAQQLAAVQQEFAGIDRLTPWSAAVQYERALQVEWIRRLASGRRPTGSKHDYCYAVMMWQMTDLQNLAKIPRAWEDANLFQQALVSAIRVSPRGWFSQNMAWVAEGPDLTQLFDASQQRVHSDRMKDYESRQEVREATLSPYNFVAKMSLRRFDKSLITTAKNQTRVNEAYVALALERHRAAKGAYPDTLAALVPAFAPALPHDLFDGQPLRYRRTPDGKYLLYSIGWNAKDDGGTAGVDKVGKPLRFGEGPDWVWQGVPTKRVFDEPLTCTHLH